MLREDSLVQAFQEGNSLEVLVAAVDVGSPFAVAAVVVEVEHRGYRVNAQTVDVELGEPVVCARYEERADLSLAVVEHARAPCLVLLLAVVGVLVAAGAVELVQTSLVLREVSGHPVEDNAYPRIVERLHHSAEVIGSTVA